jgi:allantoin racemase
VRIRYLVPLPFTKPDAVALRAEQINASGVGAGVEVECVPIRTEVSMVGSAYESLVLDMYLAEAGLRAEEEGCDAVVMDTVSDAALQPLRSRLSIPVVGPGLVSYVVAMMLGRTFSIVTTWRGWIHLYEKNLGTYQLTDRCASVRALEGIPDVDSLMTGKEEELFPDLLEVARKAVEDDGADTILLGSTTMHQAGLYLAEHLPVPVINPGPVAIKMVETIRQLGLCHSKVAYPSPAVLQDDRFFSLPSIGV